MNDQLLSVRGLSKNFRTEAEDLAVLVGLDLEVAHRESLAIMGASGSGKSTLLSILGGLDRADSGEIRAGSWQVEGLGERDLSAYRSGFVGFVFQFHYLIRDFSAVENVALPAMMRGEPRVPSLKKAAAILGELGLGDRLHHIPAKLSGGERQRTAIARALINSPQLVLADEPTGNLDAVNGEAVRELLFGLPGRFGTTVIVATHDAGLATRADRRLLMSGGKLAAEGDDEG
ncbi:MAG: ABC transporter ATP-binding protein [Rectinemataceae bacterium]